MLVPRNKEILAVLLETVDREIKPNLLNKPARSAAQTLSHMLRFVMLRIEIEGQTLFNECRVLRQILLAHRTYFQSIHTDPGAGQEIARLEAILSKQFRQDQQYVSVDVLAAEVSELRDTLCSNLRYLITIRDVHQHEDAYRSIRDGIRSYIIDDVDQEARLVDPAFDGHGPRR